MTKIEWATESWNPITGCEPISEGCDNCYARRMANRLRGRFGYPYDNPFTPGITHNNLFKPTIWKKPRRIFVCSMGDLFHKDVRYEYIRTIFKLIGDCPQHTFMILTKRPERMKNIINDFIQENDFCSLMGDNDASFPWNNIWFGVTVENSDYLWRIERLIEMGAAGIFNIFVSIEPCLGPVDISPHLEIKLVPNNPHREREGIELVSTIYERGIRWVICGAETGPGARSMKPEWAQNLRDQCVSAGVPFFFKKDSSGDRLLDGRKWEQWP